MILLGQAGRKRENLGDGSAFAHELSLEPRASIISEKCFVIVGNETVNIETRSSSKGFRNSVCRAGQPESVLWFHLVRITLSGKSLLPKVSYGVGSFCYFRALCCAAKLLSYARRALVLLEDAVGCASVRISSGSKSVALKRQRSFPRAVRTTSDQSAYSSRSIK